MAVLSNVSITNNDLPEINRSPIPWDVSVADYKIRLKESADWELDNVKLEIEPSPTELRATILLFDELTLSGTTRITTNGNSLLIVVNRLKCSGGEIISFAPENMKADSGEDGDQPGEAGEPGEDGKAAGNVSIVIVDKIDGILKISLVGQDGGDGGKGEKGAKGSKGGRGRSARTEDLLLGTVCKSGPGKGGRGGKGYQGGDGGVAGSAGNGGTVQIFNVGQEPLAEESFSINLAGGKHGTYGKGGAGGDGGNGGPGGKGKFPCKGESGRGTKGKTGDRGSQGDRGKTLSEGAVNGKNGTFQFTALDLEVVIRRSITV